MKILITGCTGLLGSNACFILRDSHDIVALSRGSFSMDKVRHYRCSFADSRTIEDLMRLERPDAVIHCAAMTDVEKCESDSNLAFEVNAYAPSRLAAISEKVGSKFVFISTDAVFDGRKATPYIETDAVNPINVYGMSKAKAEELITQYENTIILRTNMYGFNRASKLSLSEWVIHSLSKKSRIKMFTDVSFSPLLVNTLVNAIEHLVIKDYRGLVHVGSINSISKYSFGLKISEMMNIWGLIEPCSVDAMCFKARRSKNMALDAGLALSNGIHLPSIEEDLLTMFALRNQGYVDTLREGS